MKRFKVFKTSLIIYSIIVACFFVVFAATSMLSTPKQTAEAELNTDVQASLWDDIFGNNSEDYDVNKHPEYTFQIACANFNDYKGFDEAYEIEMLKINLSKINKFFYRESFGKLNVKFNIVTHNINTSYSSFIANYLDGYDYGKDMFDKVIKKGTSISYTGKAQAYILLGSVPSDKYVGYSDGALWAGKNLIVAKSTACNVLAHEMLHVFGGPDLYSMAVIKDYNGTKSIKNVDYRDLSNGAYKENLDVDIFINAFVKQQIGWLSDSFYNDKIQTGIEKTSVISASYRVNYHNSTGVNALRFGAKGKEYFLVEAFRDEGIYVQRINTNYKSNFDAKSVSELQVYAIREEGRDPFDYYFFGTDPVGRIDGTTIKYSNGEDCGIAINNIVLDESGATFDLIPDDKWYIDSEVRIISQHTGGTIINNVILRVNGMPRWTHDLIHGVYDLKLYVGDVITVEVEGYAPKTVVVDAGFVTLSNRKATISMRNLSFSENAKLFRLNYTYNGESLSDEEMDKISFTVNGKDISDYIYLNRSVIIGPGETAQFDYVANYSTKLIYTNDKSFYLEYAPTKKRAKAEVQDGRITINFEDQYATCYLKAKAKKKYLEVAIEGYDEILQTWVSIPSELEGDNNCFEINASRMSKIKASYTQCKKTVESEEATYYDATLSRGVMYYKYSVEIDKTFWQGVDDFFRGIGNWFKNLFS